MLALAGPMAWTSSRLDSTPSAPIDLSRRSSTLASVIFLMLVCPRRRHNPKSFVVNPFTVMKGVAQKFVGRQLPTFG